MPHDSYDGSQPSDSRSGEEANATDDPRARLQCNRDQFASKVISLTCKRTTTLLQSFSQRGFQISPAHVETAFRGVLDAYRKHEEREFRDGREKFLTESLSYEAHATLGPHVKATHSRVNNLRSQSTVSQQEQDVVTSPITREALILANLFAQLGDRSATTTSTLVSCQKLDVIRKVEFEMRELIASEVETIMNKTKAPEERWNGSDDSRDNGLEDSSDNGLEESILTSLVGLSLKNGPS